MGLLNLFKTFVRGQENAQDQLNENFTKIDERLEPIDIDAEGDVTAKGHKVVYFTEIEEWE